MKKWLWAVVAVGAGLIVAVRLLRRREEFDPARPTISWGATDLTIDEPEPHRNG